MDAATGTGAGLMGFGAGVLITALIIWLLIGLANDEIGYIIPRRQWDMAAPFAYGRTTPQYGEINSCGPGVAPVIMGAGSRNPNVIASSMINASCRTVSADA